MSINEFLEEWNNPSPYVHVQTSGSTGTPKPMLVEKSRMLASARITNDFLGLQPGDTALLCMSLDFIAGKMMVVRALERGSLSLRVIHCGTMGTVPSVSSVANYRGTVPSVLPSTTRLPFLSLLWSLCRSTTPSKSLRSVSD